MQKLTGPVNLIKKSVEIFFKKENFIFFIKIYLVLLPLSILRIGLGYSTGSQGRIQINALFSQHPQLVWLAWLALAISLIYVVVGFWVSTAGIVTIQKIVDGMNLSVKEIYAVAWQKLGKLILLTVITGLITIFGFVLLIIPGILFMVWFSFASYELITKGIGIKMSLGNSKRMVSGKFWAVLGRIFVFGLFAMLSEIVFSIVPFNIGTALWPLLGGLFVIPYYLLYKELSA